MKAIKLFPFALLLLVVGACSSVKIATDYDKSVNFDTFKTYAFFKEGIDKDKINDIDKKRILNAIDENLSAKGFVKTASNPDFLVNIFTKAQKQINVNTTNNFYSPFGYGYYGYYGMGYGPYMGSMGNTTSVSTSTEGTLYIDILDTKKKTLVWQGTAAGVINPGAKSLKKEELVQKYVAEILANFPPQPAKK